MTNCETPHTADSRCIDCHAAAECESMNCPVCRPEPEIVFMMGLPAAGKTTIAAQRFSLTHTVIDADSIKESHPDYAPATCHLIHAWSMEVYNERVYAAIGSGEGRWLIDGTGTNAEAMVHKIGLAQAAGFHTVLVYVACTFATSMERMGGRERKVPEAVVREKAAVIATSFEIVSRYVDEVIVIDND